MALTNIQIKKAKPKDKKYKPSDGGGLSLLINPTGSKLWKFRFRLNGKEGDYSIGAYPLMSSIEARDKAKELKILVTQGIHPKDQDRKNKQVERLQKKNTFKSVAFAWMDSQSNKWKPNHRRDVERSLENHIFDYFGDVAVNEINTNDILYVLRKIESTGALVMLSKVNQRVSHIFKYARIEGMIESNPAQDLHEVLKSPVSQNHRHVAINEVPKLLRKIDDYDKVSGVYRVTQLGLKLITLIFIRTSELRFLEWSHIDFDKALINIPADVMKMSHAHTVPLSTQALEIIEELKPHTGDSKYLFCQQNNKHKPMSENAMLYALYTLGYHGRQTVHGFRHIASTQLNEMGFKGDVIETQMAHKDTNKIRATYNKAQYLPERTEMMQAWSDYLDAIKKGADVVPINKVN